MVTRKKKEETVTEIAPVAVATVETPKRTKDTTPVKLLSGFSVVTGDDVPAFVRLRGRNNPFDEAVGEAWAAEIHAQGSYVQVVVENVKRAYRQVVASAKFHDCGISVVVDTDQGTSDRAYEGQGTLFFQPRPKIERNTGDEDEDGTEDNTED